MKIPNIFSNARHRSTRHASSALPSAVKFLVLVFFVSSVFTACSPAYPEALNEPAASSRSIQAADYTFAVMAPLHVWNWADFEYRLRVARGIGVQAVSVDVWWGDVEAVGDQQFDWTYYDTIFSKITQAGLDIVPIMSFHQCGGNVGDNYTSLVPSWIWNHYAGQGVYENDLKYRSETGAYSGEYVSLWADQYVIDEYIEFMNAFESRYGYLAADMDEINISGGPAGELRYPAYNSHDWGGYPNRGTLQAYSDPAIADFRSAMQTKYGSVANVNAAWGSSLSAFSQINPPDDTDWFFNSWDYTDSRYGEDFIDWYNQSLADHGERLLNAGISAFDGAFSNIKLGMKIPGIHWHMGNPDYPRLAEITAGLIQTSIDYGSSSSGYGYNNLLETFTGYSRPINLHFTCLEMDNENYAPNYSRAEDLVFWVAQSAAAKGINIKGENALSGGVTSHFGWNQIKNAFDYAPYSGLTVLRIDQVSDGGIGTSRMAQLIEEKGETVTVHYREFESAQDYDLHVWDGLSGPDIPMQYEGYFNGGHWWKAVLSEVPAGFKFCFTNSNGNWDGTNRTYSSQGDQVYTTPWSSSVLTYRP